jgi:hypothetical protein
VRGYTLKIKNSEFSCFPSRFLFAPLAVAGLLACSSSSTPGRRDGGIGEAGAGDAGAGDAGTRDARAPDASTQDASTPNDAEAGEAGAGEAGTGDAGTPNDGEAGAGGPTDPAQLCVDTINMFRATRSLPPYTRNTSEETCVAGEATTDDMMSSVAWDFANNSGPCSSSAENECPGWNVNPLDPTNGLVACLTQMWDEQNQAACSGCDTCDFPYSNCTNCAFNGTTACGHYLNMKSAVLTEVACGFSTGGWYTQDFWP